MSPPWLNSSIFHELIPSSAIVASKCRCTFSPMPYWEVWPSLLILAIHSNVPLWQGIYMFFRLPCLHITRLFIYFNTCLCKIKRYVFMCIIRLNKLLLGCLYRFSCIIFSDDFWNADNVRYREYIFIIIVKLTGRGLHEISAKYLEWQWRITITNVELFGQQMPFIVKHDFTFHVTCG